MSHDILIWLRQQPNPEHVGSFLTARGFGPDREPWWKDLDRHGVLSMRTAPQGPVFHCFFGPVSDSISPEYTALGMVAIGAGYIREQSAAGHRLARDFAIEFGGRVRDPQRGRWLS